jgi:hypothetical protein
MDLSQTDHSDINLTQQIVSFIESIGIPVVEQKLEVPTFLPGILIKKGTLCFDPDALKYPGDLLHEAGHIAILSPEDRVRIEGDLKHFQNSATSNEPGAILWSFAALTHLQMAPEIVFHQGGYQKDSQWLINELSSGNYIGLPLLQWKGISDSSIFPKVHQWMASH